MTYYILTRRLRSQDAAWIARAEEPHLVVFGQGLLSDFTGVKDKTIVYALQEEVKLLAGEKYSRAGMASRWGKQAGSVYLEDAKFRIEVPRVRDTDKSQEIPLRSYTALQSPRQMDEL